MVKRNYTAIKRHEKAEKAEKAENPDKYNGFKNYETWWAWFNLYNNECREAEVYKEWKATCPERNLAHVIWEDNETYVKNEGKGMIGTLAIMALLKIDWYEVAEQIIDNAEAELGM